MSFMLAVLLSLCFSKNAAIVSSTCFCAGGEQTTYDDADLPHMERQTGCIILPKPGGVLACVRLEREEKQVGVIFLK
jgi:hypothetical protein